VLVVLVELVEPAELAESAELAEPGLPVVVAPLAELLVFDYNQPIPVAVVLVLTSANSCKDQLDRLLVVAVELVVAAPPVVGPVVVELVDVAVVAFVAVAPEKSCSAELGQRD